MQEYDVITITISDGSEKEFAIMDTFTVDDQKYIAVSLVVGDEIQEGVYLYRCQETEEGEVIADQIVDMEEYDKVSTFYVNMEE
ncbi:MAG: DUF1292 domain-containing protein [Eubacteriales bacterium]|nr:DUF1292 domain-containing protein [Eubacteriales bacterium]